MRDTNASGIKMVEIKFETTEVKLSTLLGSVKEVLEQVKNEIIWLEARYDRKDTLGVRKLIDAGLVSIISENSLYGSFPCKESEFYIELDMKKLSYQLHNGKIRHVVKRYKDGYVISQNYIYDYAFFIEGAVIYFEDEKVKILTNKEYNLLHY